MPKIDADLFQLLTLFLLLSNLLALLGVLNALNSIKRELGSRPAAGSDLSLGVAPEQSYAQPASSYAQPASSYEPAYTGAPVEQRQEVSTGFVPLSEAAPATSEPLGGSQGLGQTGTPGLRGDEPEEQPFERDGRWWFKRGGELLVYDEGTGQWVAAPQAASAVTAGPAATSTFAAVSPVATAEAGEGWKCSSCGAVNGSTATSCRMCFSPR